SGVGLAGYDADGRVLDVWFPQPVLGDDPPVPAGLADLAGHDHVRRVRCEVVVVTADLDAPPTDAADVYLRLHLLPHRLVRPHGADLTGVFALLSTVAWTSRGPCAVDDFEQTRVRLLAQGPVTVYGVDNFPRMADYVVPSGVRIADADRIR